MPRRRASTASRKTSATGPVSKRTNVENKEINSNDTIDLCLSVAETLPNVCQKQMIGSPDCIHIDLVDDEIPVITIDDSDSSVLSEPKVPFTDHEKDNCEKRGGPSKYNAEFSISNRVGTSHKNSNSSAESEVGGPCFEMLFSEERVKKELPDNTGSNDKIHSLGDHSDKITIVSSPSSECCISKSHTNQTSGENSVTDGLSLPDSSNKKRISDSHNDNVPMMCITSHLKLEKVESPDAKPLETVVKSVGNISEYTLTNFNPCELDENSRNAASEFFSKNQNDTCSLGLLKNKRKNSSNSQYASIGMDEINPEPNLMHEQVLKCVRVKSEPSQDKNLKSLVSDTGMLWNAASSPAVCSSFNLSTLSLNPTEQKAAEVVGSLPSEKLQVLIKEYVEQRHLDLEPIFQETSKKPPRPFSQTDSTYFPESKHIEVILSHVNANVKKQFLPELESENVGDSARILCDSLQQKVKELFCVNLIKTENPEPLELNLLCSKFSSDETKVSEQNSDVHSLWRSRCNGNCESNENCIPSVDTKLDIKCIPSVEAEDNNRIPHSSVDKMGPDFAPDGAGCAIKPSLCHIAQESSAESVSESRNLLTKNISPILETYRENHPDNDMGNSYTCGANRAVEANLSGSISESSVQLVSDLGKNALREERCQNTDIEMIDCSMLEETNSAFKSSLSGSSCSGNSVKLVLQNPQNVLNKDISSMENNEENHQSADNLTPKRSSKAAKISNEKNKVLSNESVVMNQSSDFHFGVAESEGSEIQVKKELEDDLLLNYVQSVFSSESGLHSEININKLLSLETLRAIVDSVSNSPDNSFVPSCDVSEANDLKSNSTDAVSFLPTELNGTVLPNLLKKEMVYSNNLQLTADILHAIVQICKSMLIRSEVSSVGNNNGRISSLYEKHDSVSTLQEFCKGEQHDTESSYPGVGIPTVRAEFDKICGEQPAYETSISELEKQNVSNINMAQNSQSFTANVSVSWEMDEKNNSEMHHENCLSDRVTNSSFVFETDTEKDTDSCRTLFNVAVEENLGNGSCQNNFKGESLYDERDFICEDTEMRKRSKHFSSEVNKECEIHPSKVTAQSFQENNMCVNDYCNNPAESSGDKSESSIIKGFCFLSCKEKEDDYSAILNKTVEENVKSRSDTSFDKNSQVGEFSDGKACVPSEYGQSEPMQKASFHREMQEPGKDILVSHPKQKLQESSTCVTDDSFYTVPFSTKGSNKVQRFKSRASLLTNEMLDCKSKPIHKHQKALKLKNNEQTTCLNSDESHMLVKTPELNINTCDKNFGVSEKLDRTSLFDRDPRKRTKIAVSENVSRPKVSKLEDPRQKTEPLINKDQGKSTVFNMEDPRRKIEVLANSKHSKLTASRRNDSSTLNDKAHINATMKLNEEFQKIHGFTELQKYAQFPPYDTCRNRNIYPGVEYLRTPRYPNFSPYQVGSSSWSQCYPNDSLPYPPAPQFCPHAAGYPSQHSFPTTPSSNMPNCHPYSSHVYLPPVQLDSVPAHSAASPVFHTAIATENFVPTSPSPPKSAVSVSLRSGETNFARTEPIQSECVSSTVPRNLRVSLSQSSPLKCVNFISGGSFLPPDVKNPEIKSSKESSSSLNQSHAPKNSKSSVVVYDKSKDKSPEDFLNSVLTWSVHWLSQQLEKSSLPPIAAELKKTDSVYGCYNDYYSLYFSFLLLETWEIIFQAWRREKHFVNYFCHLKEYTECDKRMMYEVLFETIISSADFSSGKYPTEGHLVILQFSLGGSDNTQMYGYISSHFSRPFRRSVDSDHPCFQAPLTTPVEGDFILSLVVKTAWKCGNINTKKLTRLLVIFFLKPVAKQFDALVKLQYSPLCTVLLSPKHRNCRLISLSKGHPGRLHEPDTNAIAELGLAILQPNPQVIVVDVMPGTKKIDAFVQLMNIVKSHKTSAGKIKLLFCSQSNEFLDNVGCSFIYSEDDLEEKNKMHCVRMGNLTSIHPDMKNLSFHSLVKDYVQELRQRELDTCEKEINEQMNELAATIDKVQRMSALQRMSAPFLKLQAEIPKLEMKLKEKKRKKEIVKLKQEYLPEQHEREAQWTILSSCAIVLTTFSDYHQLEVFDVSGQRTYVPFTCCIIDGSNQCSELETLLPLLSGIEKLVLCGDPDIAPVVLSKAIQQSNVQYSCFRRIRSLIHVNEMIEDLKVTVRCTPNGLGPNNGEMLSDADQMVWGPTMVRC